MALLYQQAQVVQFQILPSDNLAKRQVNRVARQHDIFAGFNAMALVRAIEIVDGAATTAHDDIKTKRNIISFSSLEAE